MTSSKKARTDSKMVMETAWGKTLSSRGSIKSPLSYTKHCAKCQKHCLIECTMAKRKVKQTPSFLFFLFFSISGFPRLSGVPKLPERNSKPISKDETLLYIYFFVLFTLTGSNLFLSVCSSTEQQTGAGSIKQDFCKRSPERETVEEEEDQRL